MIKPDNSVQAKSASYPGRSAGFSLIELMLAMLIGLIIMGGVMQLYITTRDTQRTSEDQLQMLADARFAIESIAFDLRHTGLWGRHNSTSLVACHSDPNSALPCPPGQVMPLASGDCAANEYINFMQPLFGADDTNPYGGTCATQSYLAGTDVLGVRYADTAAIDTAALSANVAYVRSNTQNGQVFVSAGGSYAAGNNWYKWNDDNETTNHLLVSRVYYVSDFTDVSGDGTPSLHRVDLGVGPAMVDDVLLPGVEDFQVEYGIDTTGDGQANSYVNASNVPQWSFGEVVAVKLWVLVRSERSDRGDIGSSQTFTIAGNTVTTPNDGHYRFLISSVVRLRNTYQIDLLEAGG